ncbi:MAG: amino acid permease, partial [Candidatus Dormibacteria bacterium]
MRDGDTPTSSSAEPRPATQNLQTNAVGLAGNWILSIANVAPSASLAFTLALLISFAGLGSPLVIVVVGIAMFLVAMAYSRLNNWRPQSGAPYTWIGASVSPAFGYSMGLLMIIASLFSNIGNITLAGTYALGIVSPTATFPGPVVWLVATAIMGLCTFVAVRGIRPSVKLQLGLMGFEYTIVILFAGLILFRELVT